MQIRYATEADLEPVYRLVCDLEDDVLDKGLFVQTYQYNLKCPDTVYLVADKGGLVIGFLSMHIQRILHHVKPTCELQELNIFPEYRAFGVGSRMMAEAERIARELGLEEIELTTKLFRKRTHEFYTRLGYVNTHLKFVKRLD